MRSNPDAPCTGIIQDSLDELQGSTRMQTHPKDIVKDSTVLLNKIRESLVVIQAQKERTMTHIDNLPRSADMRRCLLFNDMSLPSDMPQPLAPTSEDLWVCHVECSLKRQNAIAAQTFGVDSEMHWNAMQELNATCAKVYSILRKCCVTRPKKPAKAFQTNHWKALFGIYTGEFFYTKLPNACCFTVRTH